MSSHQHRVGRPRVASTHTTRTYPIRFTEEERAALDANAESAGMNLAVYIRDVLEKAGAFKVQRTKR